MVDLVSVPSANNGWVFTRLRATGRLVFAEDTEAVPCRGHREESPLETLELPVDKATGSPVETHLA